MMRERESARGQVKGCPAELGTSADGECFLGAWPVPLGVTLSDLDIVSNSSPFETISSTGLD